MTETVPGEPDEEVPAELDEDHDTPEEHGDPAEEWDGVLREDDWQESDVEFEER